MIVIFVPRCFVSHLRCFDWIVKVNTCGRSRSSCLPRKCHVCFIRIAYFVIFSLGNNVEQLKPPPSVLMYVSAHFMARSNWIFSSIFSDDKNRLNNLEFDAFSRSEEWKYWTKKSEGGTIRISSFQSTISTNVYKQATCHESNRSELILVKIFNKKSVSPNIMKSA